MLNCLVNGNLLLVNLDELSLSQLLDLVRHLRLAHLREVKTHFLVDAFETLKVAFGHFVAGSG